LFDQDQFSFPLDTRSFYQELWQDRGLISYRLGNHRLRPPEETFEAIQPFLSHVGVVRLSELTQLDDLGVPVYQAILSKSKSFSVSHGKGPTPLLAKVGAAMEALERWHAGNVTQSVVRATVAEMTPALGYDVFDLALNEPSFLGSESLLEWVEATDLRSGRESYVPKDLIELDFSVKPELCLPTFRTSSNGVAAGNSMLEAALHGLCEVIERDSIFRARPVSPAPDRCIDPDTIDSDICGSMIQRMTRSGARLLIEDITGPAGVPALQVWIWSSNYSPVFMGYGCHPDKEISLLRALTEAAQSRLCYIVGLLDDLEMSHYLPMEAEPAWPIQRRRDWSEVPSLPGSYLADELHDLLSRVEACTNQPVLGVDLRKPDLDLPVLFVVTPGLNYDLH
jgi:ribosomal protein S12 methylthiotransferase accessory factor